MSDWLREKIEAELVVERDGWAVERIGRIREQLEAFGFDILVVWSEQHNAFTGPGRTIYISRRLLERLDEDATAFVIAHELAHHRLGHIPSIVPKFLPVRALLALLHARIAGPDQERHADLLAIEQCLTAGYDLDLCMNALEELDRVALDYGDVEGSLGPEQGATEWWRRARGYDSLRDRIEAVRAHSWAYYRGERIEAIIARDREKVKKRRKVALASVAGATAAVALLLLRRR